MRAAVQLYEQMLEELVAGFSAEQDSTRANLKKIEFISETLVKLKGLVEERPFDGPAEEIHFFKEVKPNFDARLIFHLRLLTLESQLPADNVSRLGFYRKELERLGAAQVQEREFVRYLSSGDTTLDSFYFLRTDAADPRYLDDYGGLYDPAFNTRMSRRVAVLKAGRLLSEYCLDQMMGLQPGAPDSFHENSDLVWSAPKVSLAEIIYAFYATGVFGNVNLQRIVKFICDSFGVRFANPYKVFEEIRLRKKNRTVFLDHLRLNLNRRMDHDDEFSL